MRKNKYQFTGAMQKPVLLALLLLVSCMVQAQRQEETPIDSVTVLAPAPDDSTEVVTDVQQPAEQEAEQKDESTKKAQYFEPRQMPGTFDSIFFRKSNDSSIAGLKNEDDFWYANTVFAKKKKEEQHNDDDDSSFSNSAFFQMILWLFIIGGFIAFLIIYLSNSNVGLFRGSKRIKDTVIDPETDDIFAIQYQQEIDKAVKAGNYRLGVRLLFLQLLRNLADKHIIEYTKDRTNFDYLLQVQHASWYSLFFRLTRNYEYVWYGQFDIDREKFDLVRNEFTHLAQQLPRA